MSQLTNYIQKELEKGFSKELILKKLLQAGYTKQEIEESFASLKRAEPLLRRKLPDYLHTDVHVQWSRWVFPLLALLVAVFFGYLVYLYAVGEVGVEEVVTDCDALADGREKDVCFLQLASLGEEGCAKIVSDLLRVSCEQSVWERNDCVYDMLVGEDYHACLYEKAIERGDASFCIGLEEKRSDCFFAIAKQKEDVSLCKNDFGCVLNMAISKKDASLCVAADEYTQVQALCYDAYAKETGDTSICMQGTFICGYTRLTSEEEKKIFIEGFINEISAAEEDGQASERDETILGLTEDYHDPLFCSYISIKYQEECLALV